MQCCIENMREFLQAASILFYMWPKQNSSDREFWFAEEALMGWDKLNWCNDLTPRTFLRQTLVPVSSPTHQNAPSVLVMLQISLISVNSFSWMGGSALGWGTGEGFPLSDAACTCRHLSTWKAKELLGSRTDLHLVDRQKEVKNI